MHWPIRCTRIHPNSSCFLRKPPLKSPMKLLVCVRMARRRSKIFRCVFLSSLYVHVTNLRNFSIFRCFKTGMVNYSLLIIWVLFRSPCIPKAIQRLFVSWIPKAFPVGKDPASKPRQLESCCNAVHVEHRVMELGINSIQKVVWQSNGCRKAFGRGWSSIGLPTTHQHHD